MKITKTVAFLGALAMTMVLIYAFSVGDFSQDGSEILANPWGIVSLVDLYVGFFLFSLWIVFREKHAAAAVVWVILMMVLGFFTASVYILYVAWQSKGDWLIFFLGARKERILFEQR